MDAPGRATLAAPLPAANAPQSEAPTEELLDIRPAGLGVALIDMLPLDVISATGEQLTSGFGLAHKIQKRRAAAAAEEARAATARERGNTRTKRQSRFSESDRAQAAGPSDSGSLSARSAPAFAGGGGAPPPAVLFSLDEDEGGDDGFGGAGDDAAPPEQEGGGEEGEGSDTDGPHSGVNSRESPAAGDAGNRGGRSRPRGGRGEAPYSGTSSPVADSEAASPSKRAAPAGTGSRSLNPWDDDDEDS